MLDLIVFFCDHLWLTCPKKIIRIYESSCSPIHQSYLCTQVCNVHSHVLWTNVNPPFPSTCTSISKCCFGRLVCTEFLAPLLLWARMWALSCIVNNFLQNSNDIVISRVCTMYITSECCWVIIICHINHVISSGRVLCLGGIQFPTSLCLNWTSLRKEL